MSTRRLDPPPRYDLAGTVKLLALVPGDPTVAVTGRDAWWATRTPDGPGTLHLRHERGPQGEPGEPGEPDALVAEAYGPGAGWLLDRADAIAGLRDDVDGFDALAAAHPLVARLARAHPGVRLPATGRVFHHVVPAILGQKVTRVEARRGYLGLLRHFREDAPGPHPRLVLPPDPAAVADTPYWVLHPFGVERRRADTIRRAAAYAAKLDAAPDAAEATRRLTTLPGIGAWTAAEVVRVSHGDPDAVSVGDYHLPNTVAHALAGEVRADDARMLQLLEPFRGHRGRVCRLLEFAGLGAPRFGPRMPVRSFARM